MPTTSRAQVNTGSTGSDGALDYSAITNTTNIVINMSDHTNGIYNYTYVNIPTNVTLTFIPNANNTPVVWLVQSNVVINGKVDLSGKNVNNGLGDVNDTAGGFAGPGGWSGGNGDIGNSYATSGFGPGGGMAGYNPTSTNSFFAGNASFGTLGSQSGPSGGGYYLGQASPGAIYGNNFLLPLVGGSGGGGYVNSGGGGGGGAILIAANGNINVGGSILANGGNGTYYNSGTGNNSGSGAGGSGGAIRVVASSVTGDGQISANGGAGVTGYGLYYPSTDYAGSGRIRFDTYENNFSGFVNGTFTQGSQFIVIPSAGQLPQLTVTSVGGVPISPSPSGVLSTPDAVLSAQQNNPIPIVVNCVNVPLNTPITVSVKPLNSTAVSAVGYNTGTLASSTATVSLNIPRGGGLIYATAATSN